ncbi:MAG: sodium:solute symporter family protein [Gemmatimonadota bacterium]|nr:sodium:solute symporter family protein [Gemmatimonadota bacterium]
MQLSALDWWVLALYGVTILSVGLAFARRAGRGTEEYFLAGRSMPWWLIGTSMVATTFSADTPNLVTDLVRTGGVSQNWVWWAFVITGMCTVFFYAKLWRRSGVLTDIGFYELRYSGRSAAFLRGFRAVYLGVFFNVMIMATVTLAAIKIGGVLLGVGPYTVVLVAGTATVLYSATSGLWGVLVTDLLLFSVSMIGSVAAAIYALRLPEVGGLSGLMAHANVTDKLSFLPDFSDPTAAAAVFIVPIAVQWWSTWYPGAEPGGGGYVAQRMLAATDEKNAMQATLWFSVAHYAIRPWPWILVGLASLIVYPTLSDLTAAFPNVDPSIIGNDLAYPAMLVFLPAGLLGLVVASLAAAYMSTISTHLNWGASYVVDDVYRRFVAPDREERDYVKVARVSTVALIVLSSFVGLQLETAMQAFQILLQIGAGTGLVFLLRWFWWRINTWSEISAMVISFLVAVYFGFLHTPLGFTKWDPSAELVVGVAVTTVGWLVVTFLTPPVDTETLKDFHTRIQPLGKGWEAVVPRKRGPAQDGDVDTGQGGELAAGLLSWFLGCVMVYAALFGTGFLLYGNMVWGLAGLILATVAGWGVLKLLPRVGFLT